ncbi:SpoIID/LytB domain-containing protein [Aquibacillus sp. 3ASR75-11]|uniref:SpoIID/LytB domain-containing protein n=1 Tax=Terrihalobacillus insolitus TaxID=2950438 RepID=A0A9X3WT09_9BACI|nr:SpoIID/LytB domain-containing protein [Terrihalobacillus insolitus]MDC3414023.1 SpoIID/LytB domain-containing protein [Terrihalobacillus insolitus]MDC3424113.1 SpoIID/LytB domain-containing protein [Terrihalobacillus insolitus]
MRYLLLFVFVVSFLFPVTLEAEEMVSVKLMNHIGDTSDLNIQLKGDYVTLDPTFSLKKGGNYTLSVKKGKFILEGDGNKQKIQAPFILIPKSYDKEHNIYINERPYLGAVEFRIEEEKYVRPVNQLPLEDYLKGVVPFEVFPSWGIETLKAQALAARTYAVSHINKEIKDTIQDQVYEGYSWSDKATIAVEETSGEVITFQNKLINAFYSASNGGYTENNAHVWGGKAMSYFPIKKDPHDPVNPWRFTLHQTQVSMDDINWDHPNWWGEIKEKDEEITTSMKKSLYRKGYMGDIKILSIPRFELSKEQLESKRSVKGSITIEFLQRLPEGTVLFQQLALDDVKLDRIRPMIGGNRFKSYLIESLEMNDELYTMKGKGYGHGVGMSQWGAHFMGEKGKTYEEILQFYYPGTTITHLKQK